MTHLQSEMNDAVSSKPQLEDLLSNEAAANFGILASAQFANETFPALTTVV